MILLLLFVSLLYSFLFQKNKKVYSNYLYCGIFAWNGISSNSISKDKIKILSIYNDDRGGHSIGLYYNRSLKKAIRPDTFKEHWGEKEFLDKIEHPILIGHSRKASVGSISLDNAQPTMIQLKGKRKENKKIILAHNGTITNHRSLAEKYSIDTKKLNTDSQVLAAIILAENIEVFSEYIGAASIIYSIIDEPETLYVFRGESSTYQSTKFLSEERPLHFYQENKNSIYFSSEKGSLVAIADKEDAVKEVPGNTLFRVNNGIMKKVKEFDRDEAYQKGYGSTTYPYDREVSHHQSVIPGTPGVSHYQSRQEKVKSFRELEQEHINTLLQDSVMIKDGDMIYFKAGRYWKETTLLTGKIYLSNFGVVFTEEELKNNHAYLDSNIAPFYFFRGHLMREEKEFKELEELMKTESFPKAGTVAYNKLISESSVYPVGGITYDTDFYGLNRHSKIGTTIFTGSFRPLFSDLKYTFFAGELNKIETYEEPFYPENFTDKMDVTGLTETESNNRITYNLQPLDSDIADAIIDSVQNNGSKKELEDIEEAILEAEQKLIENTKKTILNYINSEISQFSASTETKMSQQFVDILKEAYDTISETELAK